MLCKLMKHRGVNLDFLTQAISDNYMNPGYFTLAATDLKL